MVIKFGYEIRFAARRVHGLGIMVHSTWLVTIHKPKYILTIRAYKVKVGNYNKSTILFVKHHKFA